MKKQIIIYGAGQLGTFAYMCLAQKNKQASNTPPYTPPHTLPHNPSVAFVWDRKAATEILALADFIEVRTPDFSDIGDLIQNEIWVCLSDDNARMSTYAELTQAGFTNIRKLATIKQIASLFSSEIVRSARIRCTWLGCV